MLTIYRVNWRGVVSVVMYVCNRYFSCIMYADDLLLMSASVSGLERMLDICYRFGVNN